MKRSQPLIGFVVCLFLMIILVAIGSGPVVAADVCDKKPELPKCSDPSDPPPDPDPVDPGALCANSGSYFPAFVYEVEDQLFLSDAAGGCAIAIYEAARQIPWGKSFRYFPEDDDPTSGYGRLAWVERDDLSAPTQLYTAEFHVDNGAIVETLPLTPTPLTAPESHIANPALSANASQVYATGCEDTTEKCFIDVFDLETGVRSPVFETTPDEVSSVLISGMEPGLADQRLYFRVWAQHAPDGSFDYTQSLVYIERGDDGNWPGIAYDASDARLSSEPTVIMVDDYRHGGALSVGFWDHNGDGELNAVLSQSSYIVDFWEVEILDVENCVDGDGPCFVLGSRSASGHAYEGDRPSLTSFSENPPSLLAIRYDAVQLDLDTGILQTLITAKNKHFWVVDLDSAD
jgi:hypothetical protein